MAEQVTKMAIKVDLQCRRCYKKIKKILCEIPQVKDQSFDEKQNAVTITVVGGCPENVRQKILRKGRCFVQAVDILPEQKPKQDPKKDKGKGKDQDKTEKDADPKDGKKKPNPNPAPPVCVIEWACACTPCLNRGCDGFCPCNCHRGWPPMCDDGCGRPPMCHDGCGRPAHECGCQRPSCLGCSNRCSGGNACSSRMPCGCGCGCGRGRPPVCSDAGYPQCQKSCLQM